MVARPFVSDSTATCDEDMMTGIGFLVMMVSPIETIGGAGAERDITDWNATPAPSTAFGGVDESVTRTVTGWKLWPTGTNWISPATGCNCSVKAGTAVPLKLLQGLFPGPTQALTCTSPVVAVEELRVADPFVKK